MDNVYETNNQDKLVKISESKFWIIQMHEITFYHMNVC